jgi:hypothetical protein
MNIVQVTNAAPIQSRLTFKVEVEVKINWVSWYPEIEVVRTEEENYIDHECKILNQVVLPELSEVDKAELFETVKEHVDNMVMTGQI